MEFTGGRIMNVEKVTKSMKETIGVCYVNALVDVEPLIKIASTRRLLTLLSGAVNINDDKEHQQLVVKCINQIEQARAELTEGDENWGHAMWLSDQVLDMITPMIYSGYGIINDTKGFSLQQRGGEQ
jgi:hypothetical protein